MNLREIRQKSGKLIVNVSAETGVSPNTVAKYEFAPESLNYRKREILDRYYDGLRKSLSITGE